MSNMSNMSATSTRTITIPFLGARTYIHASTLFEAATAGLPGLAWFSFKLQKPILTNRLRIDDALAGAAQTTDDTVATLEWRGAEGEGFMNIRALDPVQPLERIEDTEAAAMAAIAETPGEAAFTGAWPFPAIRMTDSLFRRICLQCKPLGEGEVWLLAAVTMDVPAPDTPLKVVRDALLPGGRLLRAKVLANDVPCGQVFASVGHIR